MFYWLEVLCRWEVLYKSEGGGDHAVLSLKVCHENWSVALDSGSDCHFQPVVGIMNVMNESRYIYQITDLSYPDVISRRVY